MEPKVFYEQDDSKDVFIVEQVEEEADEKDDELTLSKTNELAHHALSLAEANRQEIELLKKELENIKG